MSGLERGRAYRTNIEDCPNCGVSLQGEPIPEDQQEAFGATHFSRKIGISSWEQDRTTHWQCPDCDHRWDRA
jgi:hypothetical protein